MTTIQITLPDQLAKEAEEAGLLAPEVFAKLLEEKLQKRSLADLLAAAEGISVVNDLPYMSPEEVAKEIKLMRAEKRSLTSA